MCNHLIADLQNAMKVEEMGDPQGQELIEAAEEALRVYFYESGACYEYIEFDEWLDRKL